MPFLLVSKILLPLAYWLYQNKIRNAGGTDGHEHEAALIQNGQGGRLPFTVTALAPTLGNRSCQFTSKHRPNATPPGPILKGEKAADLRCVSQFRLTLSGVFALWV